jgi:hypothetical protein
MYRRYRERVAFLGICIREAHAADGWWPGINKEAGIMVNQPKTFAERCSVAQRCSGALQMTMPLLVDEIDDRVGHAYSGMPDRLYMIGRDGKVLYKGGRGPFGFRPREMEQALILGLLEQEAAVGKSLGRRPWLANEEVWKRLSGAPETAQRLGTKKNR